MRGVEDLTDEQRAILRYTDKFSHKITRTQIRDHLSRNGYSTVRLDHQIQELIDDGYMRAKTYGHGADREEYFFNARWIGAGNRAKKRMQGGANPIVDLYKMIVRRIFGSIFILFGLGFLLYQDMFISTGKVVFGYSGAALDIAFILSFILMILGGILLFQSFKK